MYCHQCFINNRPRYDQKLVLHGSNRNDNYVYAAVRNGIRGFSPHLVELLQTQNDVIHFRYACSMHYCGITTSKTDTPGRVELTVSWKQGTMTVKDWNALIDFKHTGYEV
jgi:hypothetical protein